MTIVGPVFLCLLLAVANAFTTPTATVSSVPTLWWGPNPRGVSSFYETKQVPDDWSSTVLSMTTNSDNDDDGTDSAESGRDWDSIQDAAMQAFSNFDTNFDLDFDVIKANVLEGDVGNRGEVWTAAWLLVISCILLGGIPVPFLNNLLTFLGGPGLMLGGAAVIVVSLNDLGSRNLTPFLTPVSGGTLVTDGIFGSVRHPIYAGLIAVCAGISILTGSATRLVITALLILVLDVKSDQEEDMLSNSYPEYAAYRETVTGKFLPGDWTFFD